MAEIIIDSHRQGYSTDQVGKTLTVEELIGILQEYQEFYGEDTPVYIGNDNRYTYGAIRDYDVECLTEEDEEGMW